MLHRYALKIAYNGFYFHGFARQPQVPTVEGTIIELLQTNNILSDASLLRYASRTDKGVSALGNVIAFYTEQPLSTIKKNLKHAHGHVLFYAFEQVDETFHPRHASLRQYRYYLPQVLINKESLADILSIFTGEHNYSNFARIEPRKNPVRCIQTIILSQSEQYHVVDIYAQTFLWQQIRRIFSAVIKYADKKISKDDIIKALSKPIETYDFGLASTKHLLLYDVYYQDVFTKTKHPKCIDSFEKKLVQQMTDKHF